MHMAARTRMGLLAVALFFLAVSLVTAEEPNQKLQITRSARVVDLSTQLVNQTADITILNEGDSAAKHFLYSVEDSLAPKLAYISAKVKGKRNLLQATESSLRHQGQDVTAYRITFPQALPPSESITITVMTIFSHSILPHPSEITQSEKQLVQFAGNTYLYTSYRCKTQSTDFILPDSAKIESFTRVAPVSNSGNKISYGPYSNIEPYSISQTTLHFENNGPFMTVVSLLRLVQVSHWGMVQVEEHLHIKHTGALLKGSFSRYDYQRNPNSGVSSVKSFITMLPAGARDVYYRDEIGNISTSHLREDDEYNELLLRPRFPLFGGWQTRYYIGYNIPSYEYLFHSGSSFALKMRVVDHVFDNQVVDEVTVRIILPEGCKDIVLKTPYDVEEDERTLHFTYLDTVGRPVIQFRKTNLVEEHIEDFELHYVFQMPLLLQEPLLVVGGLLLFFLLIIIIVRLDFSITKDPALLAKQQASVIKESVLLAADRRMALVSNYLSTIDTFKRTKDAKTFKSAIRSLSDKFHGYSDDIAGLVKELQSVDAEGVSKVNTLQKKCSDVLDLLVRMSGKAEQVVAGKIPSNSYAKEEDASRKQLNQLTNEASTLIQSI